MKFDVRKAFLENDRPAGWGLFIDDQWHERFPRKRDAIAYGNRLIGNIR